MKTRFESLGLYLPEKIVSTQDLLSRMKKPLQLDLERKTGIKNRRVCSEQENSYTLALNAAKDCLKNSSYKASDLDVIINASITHHKNDSKITFEPAFSLFIKNELDISHAMNFDISNACAGMTTGAYILDNMIKAGIVNNGMVVSGEHNSLVHETALNEINDIYDDQISSLTVGDCGAAFIMDKSTNKNEGINYIDFLTMADYADLCICKPSNNGLVMYTKTKDMHASNLIYSWPKFLKEIHKKKNNKYSLKKYNYIITHQVSVKAIDLYLNAARNYFNMEIPETLTTVKEFGNTSSTTHFAVIYDNIKKNKFKEGSKILLFSSASGIGIGFISFILGQTVVKNENNNSINIYKFPNQK